MTIGTPAAAAFRAAWSFVAMPPTDTRSTRSRASRAISSVTASTVSSFWARAFTVGSSV